MSRRFRWITIIVVVALSLVTMLPLSSKVKLGLDLQGGMHVVLGVDTEKAVEAKLDSLAYQLRQQLQTDNVSFSYVQKTLPYSITVGVDATSDQKAIDTAVANYLLTASGRTDTTLRYTLPDDEVARIRDSAVAQSLEVIRNRVDEFGVAEPLIQRQGTNQILVQLPGVTDPQRAVDLIGQTAQLRFYLVDDRVTQEQLESGRLPYDTILLYQKVLDENNREVSRVPYPLKRDILLTGENLMDAGVTYTQLGEPAVSFQFDQAGSKIFREITTKNTNKQLAIVLDDNVYSAPSINEPIPGGQGTISGRFTMAEANDLAIVLRAGSLPAPVNIDENRTVGASLGADSIRDGVKASVIGLAFIMVFMLIYYKLSGMVANIGLICNFVVLLGALCALQATLTLPGIAGVILTLGIAVDANVLIFERIREELRSKRTVLNAFEIGYKKAFATILDANVTSLIAALVLFQFGTGPVKGFAVTLSLGLIASMFTAVFITRTVFMEFIIHSDSQKISI
jgi:preprotein translocase subunit SecD